MSECDYDELSVWQDILDDVMNGHVDGLVCGRWFEGVNAY